MSEFDPNQLTTANFFIGKVLGEGSYARVVHGKLKNDSTELAIKIMDKAHIKKEDKVLSCFVCRLWKNAYIISAPFIYSVG